MKKQIARLLNNLATKLDSKYLIVKDSEFKPIEKKYKSVDIKAHVNERDIRPASKNHAKNILFEMMKSRIFEHIGIVEMTFHSGDRLFTGILKILIEDK